MCLGHTLFTCSSQGGGKRSRISQGSDTVPPEVMELALVLLACFDMDTEAVPEVSVCPVMAKDAFSHFLLVM